MSVPFRASLALWLVARVLDAQSIRYEVSVPDPTARAFHVTAQVPTGGRDTLYLSLPAWSPGAYEIQNYARYVHGFDARGAQGRPLFWDRLDKDTWRVVTERTPSVTVAFDFLADTIDLSLARVTDDFGAFLGTNLFLFEEGHLDRAAEVRFSLPAGWRVTTALRGRGPAYTATDYHELADAMTFVGKYALDSVRIDGKVIRLAVWPSDAYTPAVARGLRTSVERLAAVENQLMGGPPYDTYTIFFNVVDPSVPFGGGLEHSSSQFDILPGPAFADAEGHLGDFVVPLLSHEFFHLWNVKRIRPSAMWPYDYHTEQYTPLLWWSEGVTDYYADLSSLRSNLWTEEQFLDNVERNMDIELATPEPWSVEDGSLATWIQEVYVNSSQRYYQKGSLLGLLLDIAIRDATDNGHSLDEVMQGLYRRFYQAGRGFTTADLLGLLREAGMPDVGDFYQQYVNGRDSLPYAGVLARAGLAVRRDTTTEFALGVQLTLTPSGDIAVQRVHPEGTAASAGLRPGDILVAIGDIQMAPTPQVIDAIRTRFRGKAGTPLTFRVRRDGRSLTLTGQIKEQTRVSLQLARVAQPSDKQQRVWHGLAAGTTRP